MPDIMIYNIAYRCLLLKVDFKFFKLVWFWKWRKVTLNSLIWSS